MNSNGLERHYDTLSPWERVPLVLAAYQRGDEAEGERLARSAPANSFRVPNHFGLSEGLRLLAVAVRLDQLDLSACFWRVETFVADWSAFPSCKEDDPRVQRLENVQKFLAYRFLVLTDAWRLLCAELHLAPDFQERYFPGTDTVARMEELARLVSFTPEEALAHIRQKYEAAEVAAGPAASARQEYHVESVAEVVKKWREYLDEHLNSWA